MVISQIVEVKIQHNLYSSRVDVILPVLDLKSPRQKVDVQETSTQWPVSISCLYSIKHVPVY